MITPGHPVFRELAALQKGIDIFPDPQEGAYALCRAYNSNATGCGNGRKKHENRINALLAEFRGMIECPHTDTFYHQLTEFLTITHCFWHRDELLARLEEWKKQRQQGASSLSISLTASGTGCSNPQEFLSEKSNATASIQSPCVKQPVQLGIDRTVAEDTSKATSAKSASSSACLSVMDSILLSNLSPMSATTIGSTVETTNSAEIGDIATGVSKLKLVTSHHSTSDGSLLNAAEDIIPETGIASLQFKGMRRDIRDTSPVLKEMYKYLNKTQHKKGVVYILEHSEIEGLFKVGWTTKTAAERQLQPTNCYGTKTNVIHETIDGPFVGAQKVEALVHTILQHYNLEVTKCELCGKGHNEWFLSRRELVCDTVMNMENFVRLPAYTLQDGEMKLSPAAHEIINNMCSFSLQKLADITASMETQFEVEKHTIDRVTEITSPKTQRMTTELLEQQAREGTVQGMHDSGQPTTPSPQRKKKRIGARLANTIGKATDWARIRSREATPEAGEAEIETTGDRKSTPVTSPLQGIIEDACVGFVWNMLPEEVKASEGEQDGTKNNRPRSLTDLKRVMRKAYQNVRSDFKAEWQERREEGKA